MGFKDEEEKEKEKLVIHLSSIFIILFSNLCFKTLLSHRFDSYFFYPVNYIQKSAKTKPRKISGKLPNLTNSVKLC